MRIKTCQIETQNLSSVLGLTLQSVRFPHPELKWLLGTFLNKRVALKLTEAWLTENIQFTKLDILLVNSPWNQNQENI